MADPRKGPRKRTTSPLEKRRTLERQFDRIKQSFFDGKISQDDANQRLEAINQKLDRLPDGRPRQTAPTEAVIGTAIGATVGLIGVGVFADVAAGI